MIAAKRGSERRLVEGYDHVEFGPHHLPTNVEELESDTFILGSTIKDRSILVSMILRQSSKNDKFLIKNQNIHRNSGLRHLSENNLIAHYVIKASGSAFLRKLKKYFSTLDTTLFIEGKREYTTTIRYSQPLMVTGISSLNVHGIKYGSPLPVLPVASTNSHQLITIADTGVDVNHCFFQSRSNENKLPSMHLTYSGLETKSLERVSNIRDNLQEYGKIAGYMQLYTNEYGELLETDFYDEPGGHGTHCGSIAAGWDSGTAKCNVPKFYSPYQSYAKLFVVDFSKRKEDPILENYFTSPKIDKSISSGLSIPVSLYHIFEIVYAAGSRIMSNSWGGSSTTYTFHERDIDEFVYKNKDFIFIVSAGNSGDQNTSGTLKSPCVAKNSICVGATLNSLDSFLNDEAQFYQNSTHVRELPLYQRDKILNNTNELKLLNENYLADFTSNGPTFDGRRGVDLVAPGVNILAAKGETSGSSQCFVFALDGTSMACPNVAKMVSMITHTLQTLYTTNSFTYSLVKSILLTFTEQIKGGRVDVYFNKTENRLIPNLTASNIPSLNEQGRGRLMLREFFNRDFSVPFYEKTISTDDTNGFKKCYQYKTLPLNKIYSKEFVATLVWADPPSLVNQNKNLLINDLDLLVYHNLKLHSEDDHINPDEQIRIPIEHLTDGDIITIIVKPAKDASIVEISPLTSQTFSVVTTMGRSLIPLPESSCIDLETIQSQPILASVVSSSPSGSLERRLRETTTTSSSSPPKNIVRKRFHSQLKPISGLVWMIVFLSLIIFSFFLFIAFKKIHRIEKFKYDKYFNLKI